MTKQKKLLWIKIKYYEENIIIKKEKIFPMALENLRYHSDNAD